VSFLDRNRAIVVLGDPSTGEEQGAMAESSVCPVCAFERSRYDRRDLLRTLRALAPIWRTMTVAVPPTILAESPPTGGTSILEHISSSRDAIGRRLVDGDVGVQPMAPTVPDALRELDELVARANERHKDLDDESWAATDAVVTATVHDAIHHLRAGGRVLHALGAGAPHQVGTLVQVNGNGGGVPKPALPSAVIDGGGLVGDAQADRVNHGAPLQALCLWSTDVMDALNDEGHALFPGAAGENLTVTGIEWATIRPGVRLTIGDVEAEISAFAVPCAKNAPWFADGYFRRMDHDRHPGWSRAYAWVLRGGEVRPGDPVVVE
jgi:MOSC domain-containing protein YiiM